MIAWLPICIVLLVMLLATLPLLVVAAFYLGCLATFALIVAAEEAAQSTARVA
jgi:hypothetical protein